MLPYMLTVPSVNDIYFPKIASSARTPTSLPLCGMRTGGRSPTGRINPQIPQTLSSFWTSRLGLDGGVLGLSADHASHRYHTDKRPTGKAAVASSPENRPTPLSSDDDDTSDELERAIGTEPAIADGKGYLKLKREPVASGIPNGPSCVQQTRQLASLCCGRLSGTFAPLWVPLMGAVPMVVLNFATCATYGVRAPYAISPAAASAQRATSAASGVLKA